MKPLKPSLWFDGNAEEAAEFYVSVFKNSRIVSKTDYPGQPGTVLTIEWELDGTPFMGLNGGGQFTFDEAVSFTIDCADQAEVDYYWDALLEGGGQTSACGWLKDRFGLSWQVVPDGLVELFADPDPDRARRAFEEMQTQVKLDIAAVRAAADG